MMVADHSFIRARVERGRGECEGDGCEGVGVCRRRQECRSSAEIPAPVVGYMNERERAGKRGWGLVCWRR
ncbi:hypothetical protein HanIR_Chr14g0691061 [Helianthus annuus]|nr:hypothetical protein HanIR_Chr14g0691061 [Helianthus annuus]